MKIFKHTFYVDRLEVDEEGNIIELPPKEFTYNFSMTLNGMKLFEDEIGKPLITVLANLLAEGRGKGIDDETSILGVIDGEIIRALAASSYLKIVDNEVLNNEVTLNEFKELDIYKRLTGDTDFVVGIIDMTMQCITDKNPKKNSEKNKSKKK